MKRTKLAISLLLTVPFLVQCSSSDDTPDTGIADTGTSPVDTGMPDTGQPDTGRPDTGRPDTGVEIDDNDTIATADPAEVNGTPIQSSIFEAGDRDFFAVELTAGTYFLVFTVTEEIAGTRTDPVLRLHDSAENLIAENDDSFPRIDVDSEIIYYVPASGTYYVEVREWSDWDPTSEGTEGGSEYQYGLGLRTLNANTDGINVDPETGDEEANSAALTFTGNDSAIVAGTFDGRTDDVDFYSFGLNGNNLSFRIDRMPVGPNGYGSTATGGALVVRSIDTGSVAASLDLSGPSTTLQVPAPRGGYRFSIEHGGGAVGANDFYVLKTFVVGENRIAPPEPNDNFAQAGALIMTDDGTGQRSDFILTTLEDGDSDYFSFDVAENDVASAACGAEGSGSGVRGMTVELFDAMQANVGASLEMPPNTAFAQHTATATNAGTYFVRVSKSGQAAGVDANWVRCGIRAGPAQ